MSLSKMKVLLAIRVKKRPSLAFLRHKENPELPSLFSSVQLSTLTLKVVGASPAEPPMYFLIKVETIQMRTNSKYFYKET